MIRLTWIGIAVMLCSCVSTASVVRSRFAKEQGCPEDQVVVDERGGTQYSAHGCEKETTYVCGSSAAFNRGGIQCAQEGLPSPPGYREPEHPVQAPPDPRIQASP